MISDKDLYTLAIFLGSLAMLLIVLYHFLEINAEPEKPIGSFDGQSKGASSGGQAQVQAQRKEKKVRDRDTKICYAMPCGVIYGVSSGSRGKGVR